MTMEKEKKKWGSNSMWGEELELLKSIIHKSGLTETIKWGAPVFTYKGKNIAGVVGFKNHFTLWFYKGVFLKDEAGLLVNANEENTKSLRQWRFTAREQINENLVLQYIYEAIEIEKAGLAIKQEKKETVIPALLQNELDTDPYLAEKFSGLTPFRQREYCEFIETAKQEKTKLARLDKIRPLITAGIGLHDKYRQSP